MSWTACALTAVATSLLWVGAGLYTTHEPLNDNVDVQLMSDGTPLEGNGVWDGERVRGPGRLWFYLRHPTAPRPTGNGDLWVFTQQQKWTKPIEIYCDQKGLCTTRMPPNELT